MELDDQPTITERIVAIARGAGCSPREVLGNRDLEANKIAAMLIEQILERVGSANRGQKLEEAEIVYGQASIAAQRPVERITNIAAAVGYSPRAILSAPEDPKYQRGYRAIREILDGFRGEDQLQILSDAEIEFWSVK